MILDYISKILCQLTHVIYICFTKKSGYRVKYTHNIVSRKAFKRFILLNKGDKYFWGTLKENCFYVKKLSNTSTIVKRYAMINKISFLCNSENCLNSSSTLVNKKLFIYFFSLFNVITHNYFYLIEFSYFNIWYANLLFN